MKFITLGTLAILTLGLCSCSPQNILRSSQGIVDSSHTQKSTTWDSSTMVLKPDNKITVSIWNHDDLSVGSLFGIYNSNEVYGKWVMIDQDGEVALPQIGKVHLGGLTIKDAESKLIEIYKESIKAPIVVIKVINKEVTILGEVKNPGVYVLDKEKNSLLELLGKAGGLDFYANKKEIQIVRGKGKDTHTLMIDLTSMKDYKNKDLNIQSGDVVIIPTRKGKMLDKKAPVIIPFVSLVTAVVVLLNFMGKQNN